MKNKIYTIILLAGFSSSLLADGIIVPDHENYPYDYLKNKVSDVQVKIHGIIALTQVYQEFENEWNMPLNGVYSFPLPQGARATRLQYTLGDSLVDAVLKERQQSTNPGTGEGGVVSEINRYMGSNVLTLKISNIGAGEILGVQLSYISTLDQYEDHYKYRYPLNTSDFVKHALDYLKIHIELSSSKTILSKDLGSHPGFSILSDEDHSSELFYLESKAYVTKDIEFTYQVENEEFGVDLFSYREQDSAGYFTLVGKPPAEAADTGLHHNITFILSNSNTMLGNKLNQSKKAISLALGELTERDSFRLFLSNNEVVEWNDAYLPATLDNISAAQSFIEDVNLASGNRLDLALMQAILSNDSSGAVSSVLAFTDGKSPMDPFALRDMNASGTGLFFVAIGNSVDRVRLDATASLNYGFVTYIHQDHVLSEEMLHVFQRIRNPLMKDISIGFEDPGVYDLKPSALPAVFAGSDFIISGRYQVPGSADIQIEGISYSGETSFVFEGLFADIDDLSRLLWAKTYIDELEAQILIYGENDSMQSLLTNLSLQHNIRCRYTAFVEVSSEPDSIPDDEYPWDDTYSVDVSHTYIHAITAYLSNYPNPFVDYTILRVNLPSLAHGTEKLIRIFDAKGRLILEIELSSYKQGEHELILQADQLGKRESGFYYAQLVIDKRPIQTLKLLKVH